MICPHCNAAISDDSAFCSACGKRLEQSEEQVLPGDSVVCPGCGSVNSSGANFCTNCRAPLSKTALEHICGKQDKCVGYQDAWRLTESYSRATFSVLDMAGHNLQIEQPHLFNELVIDWLLRIEQE